MSRQPLQPEALLELWSALLRYRWRFVLPALGVTGLVVMAALLLPRKYKAEAIFDRRTDVVMAEIISNGKTPSFQDPKSSLNEELAGRIAIDQVIQSVKPLVDKDIQGLGHADLGDLRSDLQKRLQVSPDVSSANFDRVRVSFVSEDPALARVVVNTLVRNYIDRARTQIDQRLREASGYFAAEVKRGRERIEELENQKLAFEINHGALLPENPRGVQTALGEAQERLADIQGQRDAAAVRVQALADALEQTPAQAPSVVTTRNPELNRLEDQLRQLQAKLNDAVGIYKMTDNHPDLIALREQIAGVKQQIGQTQSEVVAQRHFTDNPKRGALEMELTQARAQLAGLEHHYGLGEAQVKELGTQTDKLFPVRSDYRKLVRQSEEAQRQVTFWEDNLNRVQMALGAEAENKGIRLDFVVPCEEIRKPVSPALMQVLLAAIGLGLVTGSGCVFLAYRTNASFTNIEQMQRSLSVPLLGSVDEVISHQQRRMKRFRDLVLFPGGALAMASVVAVMVTTLYVSLEKPAEGSVQTPIAAPAEASDKLASQAPATNEER